MHGRVPGQLCGLQADLHPIFLFYCMLDAGFARHWPPRLALQVRRWWRSRALAPRARSRLQAAPLPRNVPIGAAALLVPQGWLALMKDVGSTNPVPGMRTRSANTHMHVSGQRWPAALGRLMDCFGLHSSVPAPTHACRCKRRQMSSGATAAALQRSARRRGHPPACPATLRP